MIFYIEKLYIAGDTKKLENLLGVKVYKISALKQTGIDELVREIDKKDYAIGLIEDNLNNDYYNV